MPPPLDLVFSSRMPISNNAKKARRREHMQAKGEVKAEDWMMNPLSPRCRYDPRHRMPLRKLKDHEERWAAAE
jgi:hypothetical protein